MEGLGRRRAGGAAPVTTGPLQQMPTMASDLDRVEEGLRLAVRSTNPFLTEIAGHLIAAGGKRVRPGFCIASAATAHVEDIAAAADVIDGAVAVELVHLGSLYHDDVMDDAEIRRRVESVNAKWGNLKAILAGDFLLARASEIAASLGTEVAGLLAATIGRLCEGQVLELQYTYDVTRTEESYLRAIEGKTAALLSAACRIGGLVSNRPRAEIAALTDFGRSYGMAFQIVDDVLDLVSTEDEIGKPVGHDLVAGVYTMPVIRALATPAGHELGALLGSPLAPPEVEKAREMVRSSGTVEEAISVARTHAATAQQALAMLAPSTGTTGLVAAADHLVEVVEQAAA